MPGNTAVLPVMPEMVVSNGEGVGKQDCQLQAGKRRLEKRGEEYRWLKPTLLGDDLYARQPFCEQVLKAGYSFIFTCKDTSRGWLADTAANTGMEEWKRREWKGKNHLVYRRRWVNGVPLRYEERERDELPVNYFEMSIWNEEKGKRTFFNSWVTNKRITAENVKHLADCGRGRWKIEKEHTNVLKNSGYNLKHNFGHGENHGREVFCILNLPAFLFHTILGLCDEDYRRTRAGERRLEEFFNILRTALRLVLYESWRDFMWYATGYDGVTPGIVENENCCADIRLD